MSIWDRIAPRYDAFIRRFVSEQYSEIIERTWERLEEGQDVLEIGAGTGNVSLEAARKVKSVTINDLSPKMLEIAIAKAQKMGRKNVEFVVGDATALPFPDRSFDACLLINVLHVLPEPLACLQEAWRILRPKGVLIVAAFCHAEGWKIRLLSSLLGMLSGITFRKFSATDFADMVEEVGFYVLEKRLLEGTLPLLFLVAEPYRETIS